MEFIFSWATWKLLLGLNALLGGLFFNFIWYNTSRIRQNNYKLEQVAISGYRRDYARWDYCSLFLGSITFGLPRFFALWMVPICLLIYISIVSIGATITEKEYPTGLRRTLINWGNYAASIAVLFLMGMKLDIIDETDIDYSYYLGPDYKKEPKVSSTGGRIPKVIAPHVTCFDVQVLSYATRGDHSFLCGGFVKNIPILGGIAHKMGCVFVPRGGTKDELGKTLDSLVKRTDLIEKEGKFPPLIIFPEGTCSNNTCLFSFKKGAFFDGRPCVPYTIKYKFGMVHPGINTMEMSYVSFFMCCAASSFTVEVKELPPFRPNDYLYEKHADKGTQKWEIYAWATRDVMAKVGGFGQHDLKYKDKVAIYDYYTGARDSFTFEGSDVTITYRPDGNYSESNTKSAAAPDKSKTQ